MPPLPKRNPARRNQSATKSKLSAVHDVQAPVLPERDAGWHGQTAQWWADIWSSPMAPEFDDSDRHGLFALAMLVDDFWTCEDSKVRKDLAGEIRLQRQCFGLTPIDRRRLQWEIERTDEAVDKGKQRRASKSAASKKPKSDPYSALRAV